MAGRLRFVDAWCEQCEDVRQHEVEDPGSCRCTVCGRVELLVVGTPAKGGSSLNRASPSLGNPVASPTSRKAKALADALEMDTTPPPSREGDAGVRHAKADAAGQRRKAGGKAGSRPRPKGSR